MKFSNVLLGLAAFTHGINAVAVPDADSVALDTRSPEPRFESYIERTTNEELWKRKGGGGGGGRGGGGSSGGSSGGSGSGGSGSGGGRGGSSGGSSSSGSRPGGSNGGQTTTGSGPKPAVAGSFYPGGATVPYKAGSRTPGGIAPFVLGGAALGAVGFFGAAYLYGAYSYPYTHPYYYHNATTNQNETKPVNCVCDMYSPCGCDDNGNQTYFNSIIGDGSYQNLNKSIVNVAKNDTTGNDTIFINGMLPNGTTAAGGTDSLNAAGSMMELAQAVGWWPAATMAFALAFLL
ncbi:hypothetical protein F5Y19DRAFT_435732 [Xylariaceae sp. FL1651]|nr:hypothetical protein F5Y19DRAFT_435732 [Xylariaceae sp. FL1651]